MDELNENKKKDNKPTFTLELSQNTAMILIGLLGYAWGRRSGYHVGRQSVLSDIKKVNPPAVPNY